MGGAPGEGAWVLDLVPRIRSRLDLRGIESAVVDGDLEDHPEFHDDYDAFIAPHYDANIYGGVGGGFWGRATASTTPVEDDRLGALVWGHMRALPGCPPDHFERLNVNVTDYYGFRLTSATTPGILVEHGVGAPGAPDHDWLRANIDAIADAWAAALAEYGNVGGEGLSQAEVDQIKAHTDAKFAELYAALAASSHRQMRGMDGWVEHPGTPDGSPIVPGEQINPSNAKG